MIQLVSRIVAERYLASISGRKATWSVVSGVTLAVVAQQWSEPRAWFLLGMPGSNWVLRIAAVTVAIYAGVLWLLTEGRAPQVVYAGLAALLCFCAASIWVAGYRST